MKELTAYVCIETKEQDIKEKIIYHSRVRSVYAISSVFAL